MKEQVHEIEVPCELDAMQAEFVYGAQRAELRRVTLDSPSAPEALRRRQLTTSETATASILRPAAIGRPPVMGKSQSKYRVDDLQLSFSCGPSRGCQFCDALDGNIGEAGKNRSQVVACR